MNIFTRGDDIFLFAEMKDFIRGDEMPIRGDEVHRFTAAKSVNTFKNLWMRKIGTARSSIRPKHTACSISNKLLYRDAAVEVTDLRMIAPEVQNNNIFLNLVFSQVNV